MRSKGINSEQTKRENRLLVLRLLCTMRGISRTEITNQIGLAKMTVSNITAELLQNGMIRETSAMDSVRPGAGRKQMALGISEDTPVAAGVWISRDFCMGILATLDLQVLSQKKTDFGENESAQTIADKIIAMVEQMRKDCPRRLIGVGIASIGPLDLKNGIILNPPNFYGINQLPIRELLEAHLSVPVYLQNDSNAGALAEKYFGCCVDIKNFAYVGLTNGVGAGIVIKDSLFEGSRGFSGEIGHVTIDYEGSVCHCGNRGCVETVASVPVILQRFRKELGLEVSSLEEACRLCDENPSAEALMREVMDKLSIAFVNLCNIIDPEVIVVGHEGADLTDRQLDFMEQRVNLGILAKNFAAVKVLRSSFGTLAPLYGAAVVVLKKIFDGKLCYDEIFHA